MGKNNSDKFVLLLWKNWKVNIGNRLHLFNEFVVSITLLVLLASMRPGYPTKKMKGRTFEKFSPDGSELAQNNETNATLPSGNITTMQKSINGSVLCYYPFSNATSAIMSNFEKLTRKTIEVRNFTNRKKFEEWYEVYGGLSTMAVSFYGDYPNKLNIAIRFHPDPLWLTEIRFLPGYESGPRNPKSRFGSFPDYYKRHFLEIQKVLATSTILTAAGSSLFPELNKDMNSVYLRRFPYGDYIDDKLMIGIGFVSSLLIVSYFAQTCSVTANFITSEKETQLKEIMMIMGLPGWLYWTSWFVYKIFAVIILVIVACIILFVKFGQEAVFNHSDAVLFGFFLLLIGICAVALGFLVSTLCSDAMLAESIAYMVYLLMYVPYLVMTENFGKLPQTAKVLCSLFAPSAAGYGLQFFRNSEVSSEGLSWDNMHKPNMYGDRFSLFHVFVLLIFDAVLYMLIAVYIIAVFPGEYGIAKPWNFFCLRKYWRGNKKNVDETPTNTNVGESFEEDPKNLTPAIQIQNLQKEYGEVVVVKKLNLNIYKDEITVLLGHNGAGKTTALLMVTGMLAPTSGTAIVNGYDIRYNLGEARKSIGICPQHTVSFPDLNVEEHIYMICRLKGLSRKETSAEIDTYLEAFDLKTKAREKVVNLSGGMKKKLAVAMALCGNSKIVVLDEPSVGMDPASRRNFWDVIKAVKKDRAIILSTHYMDQADHLGDRIGIMVGGELQCCGSSFFLKKKYGTGYYLIINKTKDCKSANVTTLLKKYIPTLTMQSDVGSELKYILPERQSSIFGEMLGDLENQSKALGIQNYGVSVATLEDVFLKVGGSRELSNLGASESQTNKKTAEVQKTIVAGWTLIKTQIYAMLLKRNISAMRSWVFIILLFMVPMVLTMLMLLLLMILKRESTEMKFVLDGYENPIVLVKTEDETLTIYQNYKSVVKNMRKVDDINKEIVALTKEHPKSSREKYIIGATFSQTEILAWFENDAIHSVPLSYSLVLNALYKKYMGIEKSITFSNYPLPKPDRNSGIIAVSSSLHALLGMAFVVPYFIIFYIVERSTKAKHLQFVSNTKVLIFWSISFLWDLVLYMLVCLTWILIIIVMFKEGINSGSQLGRIILILLCGGIAVLAVSYFCSNILETPIGGFNVLSIYGVVGLLLWVVIRVYELIQFGKISTLLLHLHNVFVFLFAFYAMMTGIQDVETRANDFKTCKELIDACKTSGLVPSNKCASLICKAIKACCDLEASYYAWKRPGIATPLIFPLILAALLFCFILAKDYGLFSIRVKSKKPKKVAYEDLDVIKEKLLIHITPISKLKKEYKLVLKDLTKYYRGRILAVNGLNLAVKSSECFGILGINGAGKTTIFKMITGDDTISYGDCWVNGYNIRRELSEVKKYIGYCPQFEALLVNLTARQTLVIYCLIRGIPRNECNLVAESLANDFDFVEHLDKRVKRLSGGNRRKLSTAVAVIGDPPVICLDEPTAGMDPGTKRHVLNALGKIRDNGGCIILTSDRMEECEALCTRLAIMVNGNIQCLGSVQSLKSKYTDGFTLIVKMKKPANPERETKDFEAVDSHVRKHFSRVELTDRHQQLITYSITENSLPYSKMFGIMEQARTNLNIDDYTLGQPNLDQVFHNFTQHQKVAV